MDLGRRHRQHLCYSGFALVSLRRRGFNAGNSGITESLKAQPWARPAGVTPRATLQSCPAGSCLPPQTHRVEGPTCCLAIVAELWSVDHLGPPSPPMGKSDASVVVPVSKEAQETPPCGERGLDGGREVWSWFSSF